MRIFCKGSHFILYFPHLFVSLQNEKIIIFDTDDAVPDAANG